MSNKTIPQRTVDNRPLEEMQEKYPVENGNIYELIVAAHKHAQAEGMLKDFDERNKEILQMRKELQEQVKQARRKHRYATLMAFVEHGAIDPNNAKHDNVPSILPAHSVEGQQVADYGKDAMRNWVMENAPMFLTVNWKALDNALIKSDVFKGIDNEPPARIVRKAREVLLSGWQDMFERLEELEFDDESEKQKLLDDAKRFYGVSDEQSALEQIESLMPELAAKLTS